MTVAEFVGRALARLGVGHAFGVAGSGNFHVTNALRTAGVPFVAARHEGGAATMADAWARTAGRPAVLTLHQGCGLTRCSWPTGTYRRSPLAYSMSRYSPRSPPASSTTRPR